MIDKNEPVPWKVSLSDGDHIQTLRAFWLKARNRPALCLSTGGGGKNASDAEELGL